MYYSVLVGLGVCGEVGHTLGSWGLSWALAIGSFGYVCIHIYIYICMYVCIYIYIYTCMYM